MPNVLIKSKFQSQSFLCASVHPPYSYPLTVIEESLSISHDWSIEISLAPRPSTMETLNFFLHSSINEESCAISNTQFLRSLSMNNPCADAPFTISFFSLPNACLIILHPPSRFSSPHSNVYSFLTQPRHDMLHHAMHVPRFTAPPSP